MNKTNEELDTEFIEDQEVDEQDQEDQEDQESEDVEGDQEDPQEEADEQEHEEEETENSADDDEGEVIVSIGDEKIEEEKKAPVWVKELRKSVREKDRKIKELESKINQYQPKEQSQTTVLRQRPKLSDDNIDFDEDKLDAEMEKWVIEKTRHEEHKRKQQDQAEQQRLAFQGKIDSYTSAKKSLKVSDFEDAEEVVLQSFSDVQQGIILQYSKNPAVLVYAIGKSKTRADELAKISDHVEFAIKVTELERELKIMPKKTLPSPERTLNASGKRVSVDSKLESLRAKADKTGDYTQLIAYKRSIQK